jgi:hypothetical protein
MTRLVLALAVVLWAATGWAGEPTARTSKEALQAFNDLIGSWRVTGSPEGTQAERQAGFWTEKLSWEWQFKGGDCWLKFAYDPGKKFGSGELHYLPEKNQYQFTAQAASGEKQTFVGTLDGKKLTLERADPASPEQQRLVVSLLHSNRYTYRFETKRPGQVDFVKRWQAGATKEGEAFADASPGGPECVVSGGLGTIRVSYKGQTYYVCCSGCRDAFNDEPEKYIKEYEERKKKGKKP